MLFRTRDTWLKIEDTVRNLRAGAADMRLRRANNGREMYQVVDNENHDDELLEVVDGAVEEADPDRSSSDQPRGRTS